MPLLVFVLGAVATISRRPDVIFNAQFWAEDGVIWYREAYMLGGLEALLLTRDGYFQTISRLTAAVSQLLPLAAAPLLFNLVALFWQVLPAAYLASPRFARLIPSIWARLLLAFVYIALPNRAEVHVNVTNAQTHLAFLALLLVLAPPSQRRWVQGVDLGIVTLASLSTIMCVFLVPVAATLWYLRRDRWQVQLLLVTGLTAVLQLIGLVTGPNTRSNDVLGASLDLLLRIIGGQLVLSPLIGTQGYIWLLDAGATSLVLIAGVVGCVLLGYAVMRGLPELRLFLFFSLCILLVALVRGQALSAGAGVWQVLTLPQAGERYFFFPSLAVVVALVWMAARRGPMLPRAGAAGLLAVLLAFGIPLSWRLEPLADLHFAEQAQRFEEAPPGERVEIPVNPVGWSLDLVRR